MKNKNFNIDTWFEDRLMDLGIYDRDSFVNLDDSCLESPNRYDNMKEGFILLHNAKNVGLLVDPDVDGYTSAAIMYLYCRKIDKQVNTVFFHKGKEHGLSDTANEILGSDIDLLIVPDAGSNDFEQHKMLKDAGISVLVLDHHECEEGYSQYACVINNQLSENVTNKSLSGVGVTYKFIQYCDRRHYDIGDIELLNLLDLVALGNISDMMDVVSSETRYICTSGLFVIHNKLFKAMVSKFINGAVTMKSISWSITPKINAIIRNGTMEEKMLLFEGFVNPTKKIEVTKKGKKSKINMSTYIVEICERIKRQQDKEKKQGVESFKESGKLDLDKKAIIIKVDDEIGKNITGLVANSLLGEYHRPVIILQHREDNLYGGSVRSPKIFGECENFKEYITATGLAILAQGHASAFGIEIVEENINKLVDRIEEDFKEVICEDCIVVDYEIDAIELNNEYIADVAYYKELWGEGFEEPTFLIKNVEVNSDGITMMFNKTILSFGYYDVYYNKKYCSRVFREDLGYEGEKSIITLCDIVGTFESEMHNGRTYYKVIIDKLIKK